VTKSSIYCLEAPDGRPLAAFEAFTREEALQRAEIVVRAVGLEDSWHLVLADGRPAETPWFEEAFFATLAAAKGRLS